MNPFPAVFCQDWSIKIRNYAEFARYIAQTRRVARHMRGSPLAEFAATSCLGWPARVSNPQHPLDVRHAPKILMLNALHDPATPYSWATNAKRQLGTRAVLVTYEGWGHGVYGRGPCPTLATDRYLLNRVLPAAGSRCPAVPPQVGPPARATGPRPAPAGPRPGVPGWTG